VAAAEAVYLASIRVAPQPLQHLQRRAVHPAPHAGHPARDPHLRACRKGRTRRPARGAGNGTKGRRTGDAARSGGGREAQDWGSPVAGRRPFPQGFG
jgi:hypothetical protein